MAGTPKYKDCAGIEEFSRKPPGDQELSDSAYDLREALRMQEFDSSTQALSGMCHWNDGTYFWIRGRKGSVFCVKVEREAAKR